MTRSSGLIRSSNLRLTASPLDEYKDPIDETQDMDWRLKEFDQYHDINDPMAVGSDDDEDLILESNMGMPGFESPMDRGPSGVSNLPF